MRDSTYIVLALCLLSIKCPGVLAEERPSHAIGAASEGDLVVRVRNRDGNRYEVPREASKDAMPELESPNTFQTGAHRTVASREPANEPSHVNLSQVFHIPAEQANAVLDQIAHGDTQVMWEQLQKLENPELHALYNRLDGMEQRGELRYRDQEKLLNYMKTMKDETGRFDPEGIPQRNKLNLSKALNLPQGQANDILTQIAHGNETVMAEHLQRLSDEQRNELFTALHKMESGGQFMYEDQKALWKYMKKRGHASFHSSSN